MKFPRALALTAALITVSATLACAPDGVAESTSGSNLEPRFKARDGRAGRRTTTRAGRSGGQAEATRKSRRDSGGKPRATSGSTPTPSGTPSAPSKPSRTPSATPTTTPSSTPTTTPTAEPTAASIDATTSAADATGDVSGATLGAPAHVDLVQASLTRAGGRYEARAGFAGALPGSANGSQVQSVVVFLDVDLDGSVDHEVWGHLSDAGWSPSHRGPSGASFGPASGVTVVAQGDNLVLRFAAMLIGDPGGLQWSVASEWGTYEQVASGTTAQDFAPDSGGVRHPR